MLNSLNQAYHLRIVNKSTAKSIWDSLCSTYEGNQQVKEAKANLLLHLYELFKMKEDEDIETMFARFQTLVSGLQVLKYFDGQKVTEATTRVQDYSHWPVN
jgi:hypothetical protein